MIKTFRVFPWSSNAIITVGLSVSLSLRPTTFNQVKFTMIFWDGKKSVTSIIYNVPAYSFHWQSWDVWCHNLFAHVIIFHSLSVAASPSKFLLILVESIPVVLK